MVCLKISEPLRVQNLVVKGSLVRVPTQLFVLSKFTKCHFSSLKINLFLKSDKIGRAMHQHVQSIAIDDIICRINVEIKKNKEKN